MPRHTEAEREAKAERIRIAKEKAIAENKEKRKKRDFAAGFKRRVGKTNKRKFAEAP